MRNILIYRRNKMNGSHSALGLQARLAGTPGQSTAPQATVTKLVLYSGVVLVGPFLLFTVFHLMSTITPGIAHVELQVQKLEQQPQRLRQCENY